METYSTLLFSTNIEILDLLYCVSLCKKHFSMINILNETQYSRTQRRTMNANIIFFFIPHNISIGGQSSKCLIFSTFLLLLLFSSLYPPLLSKKCTYYYGLLLVVYRLLILKLLLIDTYIILICPIQLHLFSFIMFIR